MEPLIGDRQRRKMEKLVVILLVLPLFCNGQTVDQTIQPQAHGEVVVDAVIDRIRSSCILIDDKYFMKRIAAVDTDYGKNSKLGEGGIWKVTNRIISLVKARCQTSVRPICNQILQKFSFDISKATLSDMEAQLWQSSIQPTGNLQNFITKSSIKVSCSAVKMELVFAIDASGSVRSYNFLKTLTFIKNVVKNLQIAPNMTRVAVIRFATSSSISFNLDTYDSVSKMIPKIASIAYTKGGTSTYKAMDMARISVFKKARKNVPKVFVLITDGYSNSKTRTVAAAEKLKNSTTTIFTIGVGRVNHQEMLAVASSPNCTHYYSLNSYNEIDGIISEIQRESCEAPVAVDITDGLVNNTEINNNPIPSGNETKTQNIHIQSSNTTGNQSNSQNMTNVKVVVACGIVNIFASNLFNKPSAAFNTYSAIATDNKPGWIRSPKSQQLYISLVSQSLTASTCTDPHYNISINPQETGVTIVCKENGIERKCTYEDIRQSFGPLCGDDNIPNPCTKTNILNNIMRFKHPKSTTKYIQCKISGEMEIVNCPTGTKYDENQQVCGPQIISPPQNSTLYNGSNPCTVEAIREDNFILLIHQTYHRLFSVTNGELLFS
ncbi:unnamed protein product [Acanthosepion pharaonis]|uniref:Uncharacterized protein n=1 Tax=Acanthosepion pharaonis TaxID=158019 RepID=A0A812EAK0_ACAPH|nr:unnamed protein product [Sepia pharaonis]